MSGQAEAEYGPRRAAYDLKKLRGKGMVRKIGTSRRYEAEPDGLRAMTALLLLAPQTPLLFQGQEFASATPFLFFANLGAELDGPVAAGRREPV